MIKQNRTPEWIRRLQEAAAREPWRFAVKELSRA